MRRRRRDIQRDGQRTSVILLAGLPHAISNAIANALEEKFAPARVISQSSGNDDNNLYRPETVSGFLRALSSFAMRQIAAEQARPISPSQILLAYVPSNDDERLLTEFDFCVFPVRLNFLSDFQNGRQRRHDRTVAEEYVIASLETALGNFNMNLKRRLSSPSWKDPIFLPPRNFRISGTERMADLFVAMRREQEPWGTQFPRVQRIRATHQDLPRHIREGTSKEVCSDFRSLFFPHDRTNHGHLRELGSNPSDAERIHFLRGAFRFGVPLISGYHHDVQFGRSRSLGGMSFDCSREGTIQLNSDYANIYPNDFVRPSE